MTTQNDLLPNEFIVNENNHNYGLNIGSVLSKFQNYGGGGTKSSMMQEEDKLKDLTIPTSLHYVQKDRKNEKINEFDNNEIINDSLYEELLKLLEQKVKTKNKSRKNRKTPNQKENPNPSPKEKSKKTNTKKKRED